MEQGIITLAFFPTEPEDYKKKANIVWKLDIFKEFISLKTEERDLVSFWLNMFTVVMKSRFLLLPLLQYVSKTMKIIQD